MVGAIVPAVIGAIMQRVIGGFGADDAAKAKERQEALKRLKPILEKSIEAGNTDVISQNRENLKAMGLSDSEINIYDSAAKGNKPKSPEEINAVVGAIMQGLQQPGGRQAGGAPSATAQAQMAPTALQGLVQGTMPEGAHTAPMSLYGPGEQAPTLAPETQTEPLQTRMQLPTLPSERAQQQQQAQRQQYPQGEPPSSQPLTQPEALPSRRQPTTYTPTEIGITPQGQIKGVTIGRTTPTERESETAQEITKLLNENPNMTLKEAMTNARDRGFTMDNAAWTAFGQRAFGETYRTRLRDLKKADPGGKRRDQQLLAALLAENEVGSEYADPVLSKQLDELKDNPLTDPQVGKAVSSIIDLVGSGALSPAAAEAATLRITGGKSLEKMGVRLPGAREAAFARQSPERQAQLLEPPVIVQTPQGPQAVRPTTGQTTQLPRQPLPDITVRAYSGANTVINMLDELTSKYDVMVQATGGRLSGKLRQALAANKKYLTINNFTGIAGSTPAEQEFAAAYNALMGQLKKFNAVPGSFSDKEAVFALQTIGDAATGRGNFHAQQQATKRAAAVAFNEELKAMTAGGKYDPGRITTIDPNLGQTATVKGVEGVWAGDWAEAAQIPPPPGFQSGWVTRQQFMQRGTQ